MSRFSIDVRVSGPGQGWIMQRLCRTATQFFQVLRTNRSSLKQIQINLLGTCGSIRTGPFVNLFDLRGRFSNCLSPGHQMDAEQSKV